MTSDAILALIEESYPGGLQRTAQGGGDGLATFIVEELRSVYEPSWNSSQQLLEAINALDTALRELTTVRNALEDARKKRTKLLGKGEA